MTDGKEGRRNEGQTGRGADGVRADGVRGRRDEAVGLRGSRVGADGQDQEG
jgi:hypothetical protein